MSNEEIVRDAQTDQIALRPDEIDSLAVIRRVEAITKSIDGAVKVSLQRTNSADWVKMGEKFYLQASGCQKIRSVWGIYFRNKAVVCEDYADGNYGYYVTGEVGSQLLDRFYGKEITVEADGGRSSNDPFFTKGGRMPDPQDVRKAALSNFEARAISSFLGLKNFTESDLRNNGIRTDAVSKVDYQKGAEGGGNTAVISEAQRKRLFAICKGAGIADDILKKYLKLAHKIDSTSEIQRSYYESVCKAVESKAIVDVVMDAETVQVEKE